MLRVVVAVLLAAALLGASMPAVETARIDHADARVHAELDRLTSVATRLAERNDALPANSPGARRTVSIRLPRGSMGTAALARLSIPGPRNRTWNRTAGTRIRYRVAGGGVATYRSEVTLAGRPGGTTFTRGGRHRIVLELTRLEGRRVVLVGRPDFKSDDGTTREYDGADDGTERPPP